MPHPVEHQVELSEFYHLPISDFMATAFGRALAWQSRTSPEYSVQQDAGSPTGWIVRRVGNASHTSRSWPARWEDVLALHLGGCSVCHAGLTH